MCTRELTEVPHDLVEACFDSAVGTYVKTPNGQFLSFGLTRDGYCFNAWEQDGRLYGVRTCPVQNAAVPGSLAAFD